MKAYPISDVKIPRGTVREDGMIFVGHIRDPRLKSDALRQRWLSPAAFENARSTSARWITNHKDHVNRRNRAWREANPEKYLESKRASSRNNRHTARAWVAANPEKIKASRVKYQSKNKAKLAALNVIWRRNNPEKVRALRAAYKAKNRERFNAMNRERRRTDPAFSLESEVRNRLNKIIRKANTPKTGRALDLLGCSVKELMVHIEGQFIDGMSWQNRSEWHIDHRIPFFKIDVLDERQLRLVCHYTNLRPLWKKDNLTRKYDDVPELSFLN